MSSEQLSAGSPQRCCSFSGPFAARTEGGGGGGSGGAADVMQARYQFLAKPAL